MDYIVVGGRKLEGEIAAGGSKNCLLAMLGASVLTEEQLIFSNCPKIADVDNMVKLLQSMGKSVSVQGKTVCVSGRCATDVPPVHAAKLRGSGLVLGALVGACGKAFLPKTGGCAIGSRPMDIHVQGLKALGVAVEENDVGIFCSGKPKGGKFALRFPSVGATENLLCASVLAEGVTELENCAVEPEVVALEELLVQMGANIVGVGTSRLTISGVEQLGGTAYKIIPDRIVACTYLACAAAAGGHVRVTCCQPKHFESFLGILQKSFDVKVGADSVEILAMGMPKDYGRVQTAPYPLFPTDLQSVLMSLCAASSGGVSEIVENLFENRLLHNAQQLNKMNGCVIVKGNKATICGRQLQGAYLAAQDLRGGAALVVAALSAQGKSVVSGAEHILRGYENFAENLRLLGADVILA